MACRLHFLTRGLPPFQAPELKGMVADECRLVSASVWSQTTWLWSVLCAGPVSGDPQVGGKSPRPRRSHSPAGDRPGDLEDAWSVCLPPDNPPVCSLWPCPARICWDRGTAAPHLPALCQAPPSHVRKTPDVDGLGMASMFFPTPPGSRPCSRVSPFPAPPLWWTNSCWPTSCSPKFRPPKSVFGNSASSLVPRSPGCFLIAFCVWTTVFLNTSHAHQPFRTSRMKTVSYLSLHRTGAQHTSWWINEWSSVEALT